MACSVQPQSWKYTVKNENSELLENPASTAARIFNTLEGIFGENFSTKVDFLAIILILLVYDYGNTSSQTCLLKYQFRALENVTRGMSGPTVNAAVVSIAGAVAVSAAMHNGNNGINRS